MSSSTATVNPARKHTDEEIDALVTVEVAERLATKAWNAINEGDLDEARALLAKLVDETSTRTATAVKRQELSDQISLRASLRVDRGQTLQRLEARVGEARARLEAIESEIDTAPVDQLDELHTTRDGLAGEFHAAVHTLTAARRSS